jgi:hypothetical protein
MSRKFAGRTPPKLLAGVGDDVEGAHDQAGAVAMIADLAVELDVVEAFALACSSSGSAADRSARSAVRRLPEGGVLVEGDLAVEGDHLPVLGLHERVDLDEVASSVV